MPATAGFIGAMRQQPSIAGGTSGAQDPNSRKASDE